MPGAGEACPSPLTPASAGGKPRHKCPEAAMQCHYPVAHMDLCPAHTWTDVGSVPEQPLSHGATIPHSVPGPQSWHRIRLPWSQISADLCPSTGRGSTHMSTAQKADVPLIPASAYSARASEGAVGITSRTHGLTPDKLRQTRPAALLTS